MGPIELFCNPIETTEARLTRSGPIATIPMGGRANFNFKFIFFSLKAWNEW